MGFYDHGLHDPHLIAWIDIRARMGRAERGMLLIPDAPTRSEALWLGFHITRQDQPGLLLATILLLYFGGAWAIGTWLSERFGHLFM